MERSEIRGDVNTEATRIALRFIRATPTQFCVASLAMLIGQKPLNQALPPVTTGCMAGCIKASKRSSLCSILAGWARAKPRRSKDDAEHQTSHCHDSAGCPRGIGGRVAELSQPGTGAAAARPRAH